MSAKNAAYMLSMAYPPLGIATPNRASLRVWKSCPTAAISDWIAGSMDGLL